MITCHPLMMTDWTEVLEPFHLQAQSQDNPQVNHQGCKETSQILMDHPLGQGLKWNKE